MKNIIILLITLFFYNTGSAAPPKAPNYNQLFRLFDDVIYVKQKYKSYLRINHFDATVKPSAFKVYGPFQEFIFKNEINSLKDTISTDATVMSIIKPLKTWFFLLEKDTLQIEVRFIFENGKWAFVKIGPQTVDWENVLKTYPDLSNANPVLISSYIHNYLHFPDVSSNNLTLAIRQRSKNEYKRLFTGDSCDLIRNKYNLPIISNKQNVKKLLSVTTDSYDTLIDCRKTFDFINSNIKE